MTNVKRFVPLGHGLEIWSNEAIYVARNFAGKLFRTVYDEAGPAIQRAPDAERNCERVASFNRAVAGAVEPELRSRPRREHQVAGQWHAIPPQRAGSLRLAHSGAQAQQQTSDAAGRLAGCVFKGRELLHSIDRAHAVARIDQQSGGVLGLVPSPNHRPSWMCPKRCARMAATAVTGESEWTCLCANSLPACHLSALTESNPIANTGIANTYRKVDRFRLNCPRNFRSRTRNIAVWAGGLSAATCARLEATYGSHADVPVRGSAACR